MKRRPKQTISPREKKEGTIQYGYRTWGTNAQVKETDEEGKKRGVSIETGSKKRSPNGLSQPNQNTITINIIC